MRTLLIDIETTPNLAWVWGLYNQNINLQMLEDTSFILCFASKWLGEKPVTFMSYTEDDMHQTLHDILSEADAVVHYNGDRFDLPIINKELLLEGFTPPAPYKSVDLYKVIKRKFKFTSHKLAHVSEELGIGGKGDTGGFETWLGCMNNDADAWMRMRSYNIQDVMLLEDLYHKIRPWDDSGPNMNLYTDDEGCPACGSTNLTKQGFSKTATRTYQRLKCSDCGRWSRDKHSVDSTGLSFAR